MLEFTFRTGPPAQGAPGGSRTVPSAEEFAGGAGPASLAEDETVFFVHVPKCAGSAFRSVLKRWYGAGRMAIDTHDPETFREQLAQQAAPPKAVCGHFPFGIHVGSGCEPYYLSLVRDPVERLASLYKHARAMPDHLFHPAAAALDFKAFYELTLTEPRARRATVGIQCFFLGRTRRFDAAWPVIEANYRLAAPTDQFDRFLDRAARLVGQPAPDAPMQNRRPSDPALADAVADLEPRIRQDHCEDQLLYDHVRAAFAATDED